ncbi:MAG: hypothetical protein K8M05_21240 [Deltaproteobacteria bacterium]|nr:hypothetical protein [Kofleriaceae bacterium]
MRPCVAMVLSGVMACGGESPIRAPEVIACGDLAAGHWDERLAFAGLSGPYASANALVATQQGIVVGGTFERAPGVELRNVARWNGDAWTAMGDGLPGFVIGLAVDDAGTVWAVGASSPYANNDGYVATWDGAGWTVVADDLDGVPSGVTVVDAGIAVFGRFQRLSGVDAPGLAIWDGQAWASGGLDRYAWVLTVVREPAGFCAAGRFGSAAHGVPEGDLAACRRDGEWTTLGGPMPGIPSVLAHGPDGTWWAGGSLVADGDPVDPYYPPRGLARLDADRTWRIVDGGVQDGDGFFPNGAVLAIVPEGDGVLVGGNFISVGRDRLPAYGIARWSPGSGWSTVASRGLVPLGSLRDRFGVAGLLREGGRIHVAGAFAGIADTLAVNVATLEPTGAVTAWTGEQTAVGPQAGVASLAATNGGVVMAGGIFAGTARGPVATFSGTWSAPPAPSAWSGTDAAVPTGDGGYVLSGEHVIRWNGSEWTTVAERTLVSPLFVDGDGAVYFADHGEGDALTEILRLTSDGEVSSLGHVEGRVSDFAVLDGELIAGSLLGYQEPDSSGRLWIRHTGGAWELVDGGPRGGITDLAVSPALGLVAMSSWSGELAAWDGATWRPLVVENANAIAGCDRGVVLAHYALGNELWFHDGLQWSPIGAAGRGMVAAIEMTDLGLAVGVHRPGESSLQLWRVPR